MISVNDTDSFFEKLRSALLAPAYDDVMILTHSNPDGDAVGSACALMYIFRVAGKRCKAYFDNKNKPSGRFSYLMEENEKTPDFLPSHFITSDTTDLKRVGGVPTPFKDSEAIAGSIDFVIDHHLVNKLICTNKLVLPEKCATGEIVYDFYKYCGIQPDEYAAAAMYTALVTDTGCFRYSNTTVSSFLCAADLYPRLKTGAATEIVRLHLETISRKRMEIESAAIAEAVYSQDGACAFAVFDMERRKKLDATDETLEGVSGLLRRIEGVRAGFLLRQNEDGMYKISMRSDYNGMSGIDSSAVCSVFGGGGHKAAAGGSYTGNPTELISLLIKEVEKQTQN